MGHYIFKHCLSALITLFVVSFVAFAFVNLVPADPAEVALRVNDITPTAASIAEMREQLGLDQPLLERYWHWITRAIRGDFGVTFTNNNRLVVDELVRSFPYTLTLAGLSLVMLLAISIPAGVASAVYKDHWFDRILRSTLFAVTAMPSFWLAFLLIWIFSLQLNWLPSSGARTLSHFILPAIALVMTYVATYIRLIRSAMIEAQQSHYVVYARARGLSERRILWKHMLKNSLQTSMTALGIGVVRLMAGTVVIESIFAIPGLGRLALTAIFNRDYPVIQAYILMMGALFVIANLIVDVVHTLIDPRLTSTGDYQ